MWILFVEILIRFTSKSVGGVNTTGYRKTSSNEEAGSFQFSSEPHQFSEVWSRTKYLRLAIVGGASQFRPLVVYIFAQQFVNISQKQKKNSFSMGEVRAIQISFSWLLLISSFLSLVDGQL